MFRKAGNNKNMKRIFYIVGIMFILPSVVSAVDLDPSINGTSECYRRLLPDTGNYTDTNGNCNAQTLAYLGALRNKTGTWGSVFSYGDVYGKSVCSVVTNQNDSTNGMDLEYDIQIGGITQTNQNYANVTTGDKGCWCKMEYPMKSDWTYLSTMAGAQNGDCARNCAASCARRVSSVSSYRTSLFAINSGAPDPVVTSKDFVDGTLSNLQTKISGPDGYLAVYSDSDQPASREIVLSLGSSTTSTTIPTGSAISIGLDNKQNKVSGTAGYAMLGTSTAGTVSSKPIYSNTAQFSTALVETGTLNSAVINGVNSELSCYDNDCTLWQINTTGPTTMVGGYDPSVNQTSYCYRRLNGSTGSNGSCSTSTLTYLGTDDAENKSGKWGKVFPYGNISGISVCSTISGTANTAATDAQTTTLNEEYTAQAGVGDNTGFYCWCKMINPSSSKWVYYGSRTNASTCASTCASYCGSTNTAAFRTALYNSVQ